MSSNKNTPHEQALRAQAEAKLFHPDESTLAFSNTNRMLYELQVHQIELQLQNEELRRTQLALEHTRDRYLDLYEFAPVAYFTLTAQDVIKEANLTSTTLLGIERQKLLERRFAGFVDKDDAERWHLFFAQTLQQTEPKTITLALKKANDSVFYGQLDCLPILDDDNTSLLRVALTDVSVRKQAEMALMEAARLAEDATRIKDEVLANVNHEMRTPMNVIFGMTYLAQRTNLSEEQRNYLNSIDQASKSLLEIINSILDFSKVHAGGIELDVEEFRLDTLLVMVENWHLSTAEEKSLALEFCLSPQIPNQLIGDSFRLGKVLGNLIHNAIKFTLHGKVTVSIKPLEIAADNVMLLFSVHDTGIGIFPEQLKKLFQPFSQIDASFTRRFGGIGLGLAISKGLVELMGGNLWVDSQPGIGSTFSFTVRLGVATTLNDCAEIPHKPNEIIQLFTGKKVLVAEDNTMSRELITEILIDFGIQVVTAKNGKQAVELVKKQCFDLLLIDIQMPIMDGLTAARLIRTDHQFQVLPIIAITAYAANYSKKKCLEVGINDYLLKPINPKDLIETLVRWFKLTQPAK